MIVQKKILPIAELLLHSGIRLKDVRIGYETYGQLNDRRDNAILITHAFSGTSHAAGRYQESDAEPGFWNVLIGSGKAMDTDRFFVVASDALCNLNARDPNVTATGPTSLNPETGRPYGAKFPVVTIGDFVEAQNHLREFFQIKKWHAVAGPSMGSQQALEWSAKFPEHVERVIAAIPMGLAAEPYLIASVNTWCAPIFLDPEFKNGDYEIGAGPLAGLQQTFKLMTLDALHYGYARRIFGRRWANKDRDPALALDAVYSIEAALETTAALRAKAVDANSFLRIARAVQTFSIEERQDRLRARYLFLPARSDLMLFPDFAERGMKTLRQLGLEVREFYIESDGGHLDGLNEIAQTSDAVRSFLAS